MNEQRRIFNIIIWFLIVALFNSVAENGPRKAGCNEVVKRFSAYSIFFPLFFTTCEEEKAFFMMFLLREH